MPVTVSESTAVAVAEPAFTNAERLALAGYLAGYTGLTREAYALDLRQYASWCQQHHVRLFAARRADIECFARDLEARGRSRATVTRRLCTIAGFYRYAVEEELLEHSPAAHVRRPRIDYESHATRLDRNELGALLVAAGLGRAAEHALVSLLALNGLRVSEATGAEIQALGSERGHRTLVITRKGGKIVTIPLAPRTAGLNQTAVSRIWRAFGLKPHVRETWKLSTDPQFIEKVRDVVGLYMDPPEHAVVLCVDEKTQIQAIDRTAPCLPILPTTPARRSHDYVRNGATSLFAALDVATGQVIAAHHRQHRHQEFLKFLKFLKTIDAATPAALDRHLICDNYATHKTPAVKTWLIRHPRFHIHSIPTSSSWLNLVERWFAELTNRKLRRSAHRSVAELQADIRAWVRAWNDDPRPFAWTKTADQILETLQLTNASGH